MDYYKHIEKEELAKLIWAAWPNRSEKHSGSLVKFIEEHASEIPWLDLHIVVKKDLRRFGITDTESANVKKGAFNGFQKLEGIVFILLKVEDEPVIIFHDGRRFRGLLLSGKNNNERKDYILKNISKVFIVEEFIGKFVEKAKEVIEETIEEVVEDALEEIEEEEVEEEEIEEEEIDGEETEEEEIEVGPEKIEIEGLDFDFDRDTTLIKEDKSDEGDADV